MSSSDAPSHLSPDLDPPLKVAMVTGCTGVLGQATVRMLLDAGFRVVAHDPSVDDLNDFIAALGPAASRASVYPICFDPTNESAVALAHARISKDFGEVYVLVNNNGVLSNTLLAETTSAEFRAQVSQNAESAFLVSKQLLPQMRARRWGRIVNTCSLAGKTGGVTTGVAYAVSKGAMHTLTFALAREVAKDGVTVNGIAPAYIRTPTVDMYSADTVETLLRYIPVGRFCEPEEYANTVRFLVSPLAGFITGEIIDMNGGLLMD